MDINIDVLKEYLSEYAKGNRFLSCHADRELMEFHRTWNQAETRLREDKEYHPRQLGSGGGVYRLSDEILFLIFESVPPIGISDEDLKTLGKAIIAYASRPRQK